MYFIFINDNDLHLDYYLFSIPLCNSGISSRFDVAQFNGGNTMILRIIFITATVIPVAVSPVVNADESLFGYVKGAETLPQGAWQFAQTVTYRTDKGTGNYDAWNTKSEIEYGVTNRFTAAGYLKMQAIDTSGLVIDGYLPGDKDYGLKPSGVEGSMKYNFLSPAKDDFGLSGYAAFSYDWLDAHSGQGKNKYSLETELLAQKYFMEGQLIWVGNAGVESTYAKRDEIAGLPPGFDWPEDAEMEIELKFGSGLSYRFAPNWFIGAEVLYETEFETEVGQERWSWFAGPTLHYGGSRIWASLTWLPQLRGGGEMYPGQPDTDLHLIEKTEQEIRFRFGIAF